MSNNSAEKGRQGSASKLTKTSIMFTPHYRTITESGKSHFSRVSDALAEFIDNSMEACKINKNNEWKIGIHFDISTELNYGYCVISDNGGGMTFEKLRQFAVYSLDQNTKKLTSLSQEEGNFISMYGVGAKEAGFYLGQRLRVVTRAVNSNQIMELTLDKEIFEEKFQRNENVFESDIITRGIGGDCVTINMSSDEKKVFTSSDIMSGILNAIEEEYEHFTYIVIKLSRNIIESIIDTNRTTDDGIILYKYHDIADDLGDIYHFHLHPDHTPNNILQKIEFKPQINGGELPAPFNNCEALQKLSRGMYKYNKGSNEPTSSTGNLNIFYSCLFNGLIAYPMISLRELKTYGTCQFIEKAKAPFRFNIEVPDPMYYSTKAAIGNVRNTQSLNVEEVKKITIEGILFYYPYGKGGDSEDDKETRPALSHDKRISLFNILWMNRLVPESYVDELPFFSSIKQYTALQLPTKFIPINWKARIKGYLFFDRDFPITNNKLRIQVDPDINLWLNSYRRDQFSYKPTKIQSLFESWIVTCHKSFDSEYYLEGRYLEYEQHLKLSNVMKKSSFSAFKSLKIADNKVVIDINDHIKIKSSQSQTIEFAKVTAFIASEELEPYRDYYHGPCFFRYKRIPSEIYGNEEYIKSVALIDISAGKSGPFVSDKEVELLRRQGITDIKVVIYPDVQSMCPRITNTGKMTKNYIQLGSSVAEIEAGKKYYKAGIQLLNGNNDVVVCLPGGDPFVKNRRYKVKYRVENVDKEVILDTAIESELWRYNPDKQNEEKVDISNKNKIVSDSQYSFYGVSFPKGECRMCVDVLDVSTLASSNNTANRVIFTKSFNIKTFFSKKSFNFNVETAGFLRLGGMLPPFTCAVTDLQGRILDDFVGTVSLSVNCINHPNIKIFEVSNEKPVANPKFEIDKDDKGQLNIFGDQFQLILPSNSSGSLFQGTTVETLQFEVCMGECDLSANPINPTRGKGLRETVPFMEPRFFNMQCVPGEPFKLMQSTSSNPGDSTVTVSQDDMITLDLVVMDRWDNLTMPSLGQTWYVKLEKNGPLAYESNKYGDIQVKTDGTICIPGVRIKENMVVNLKVSEEIQTITVFSIGPDGKPVQLVAQLIPVKILPSTRPCSMVIHRGKKLIRDDDDWYEEMGTIIDDLTFHFLDKNGNYISNFYDCYQDPSSGITCSWSEDRKKGTKSSKKSNGSRMKPENMKLSELTIPKKCDSKVLSFEVTAKLDSIDQVFVCKFEINVTAGAPVAWRLLTSPNLNEGLMVSTADDVLEKIRLIYLVDKNENPVADLDELKFMPNLIITSKDIDAIDDFDMDVDDGIYRVALMRGTRLDVNNNDINGYVISADEFMAPINIPVNAPVFIIVNDNKNHFTGAQIKSFCIPGIPACVTILSPVVSNVGKDASVQISVDMNFPEFVLVITDTMNNALTSFKPKSLSMSVALQLEAPSDSPTNLQTLSLETRKVVMPDSDGKISMKLGPTEEIFKEMSKYFKADSISDFYVVFSCYYIKEKLSAIPLKSAHVLFHIIKSNAVVALRLCDDVKTSVALSVVDVSCDENFPALYLKAVTDNSVPYVSNETDITVRVERIAQANRGKATKVLAFNCKKNVDLSRQVWCIDLNNSDEDSIIDSQLSSQVLRSRLTPGEYNLGISYTESRLNYRTMREVTMNVPLIVRSGVFRAVELDSRSRLQISSTVVSNGKQKNANIIATNVILYALDSNGNKTNFPPSSSVKVSAVKPKDLDSEEMPCLENADSDGFVQAIMNVDDNTAARFDVLSILPHVGSSTSYRKIKLLFIVDSTTVSCETEFNFCSDTARSHHVESLNAKLKQLIVKKQELDRLHNDATNEINLCKSETLTLLRRASTPGLRSLIGDDDITLPILHDIKKNLQRQATEFSALASQFRKPKYKPKIINHPAIRTYQNGIIGQLVLLAYVDDESTAYVLSWALRQYLEIMVVKDDTTAKLLYDNGFSVISNESQTEFSMPTSNGKRPRSEEEVKAQTLPLKKLNPPGKRVAGNPEYVINLLKLDRKHENLRDTIFWTICRNNILIDDLETAMLHRRESIRLGQSLSTYYTRTGERLGSDGILNPNVKMPQNPDQRLEYIFGGQSPVSSHDFTEINDDILIIEELEAAIQRKHETLAEYEDIDSIDEAIGALETAIQGINDELNSLQVAAKSNTPSMKDKSKRPNPENVANHNTKRKKFV